MGSNSNRSENANERTVRFAHTATQRGFTTSSKGAAEIRGRMGVSKGNAFINDMKKYR
tara:strand:- start:5786 stop:5959 length:174 start_codon:yes stop_codon:yes gene_type:complete